MALLKHIRTGLILAALTPTAQADNWAVLIGIADYPSVTTSNRTQLEGPVYDVNAVKSALVKWGFRDDGVHIVSLKDRQATRAGIIDALVAVEKKSRPGDQVFIYYSGHGTNPNDLRLGGYLNLPFGSGALIPYDFPGNGNAQAQRAALIIPREHLKEAVLDKLNHDRSVFVLFDTCYSAHTLRATKQLPVRQIDIPTAEVNIPYGGGTNEQKLPSYPYSDNIVFLAAAGNTESAVDINQVNVPRYQTIDGLPHGALTDAFLRVLTGNLPADTNHDGNIEYKELLTTLQDRLKSQGLAQNPNLLPLIEEDRYPFLRSRVMFGQKAPFVSTTATTANVDNAPVVNVQFLASAADLAVLLREMPNKPTSIKTVTADGDFVVNKVGGSYRLLNKAEDVVAEVPVSDPKAIFGRILQESILMRLEPNAIKNAKFNLELSLDNATKGITREAGDTFAFVANADEASYWLLLDVKPNGEVEVLYPRLDNEKEIRPGKKNHFIPSETEKVEVKPPFGMDHLLAFAYKKKPAWLDSVPKTSLSPESPEFTALTKQLLSIKEAYAFGKLDVLTVAKK